ncbi:MAG TPA: adenylosuccinate synthase [Gemmatimonadales bacterium]|nr:adenylosuccinate synthase [Gemmatimonadales bacterium]
MFDSHTNCVVVVGAQWGDEGKGKLVDVLAEQADLVVRYQGGANAGHTVVIGDSQFILRQTPSGILHPGVICVIGNGVVLDPETFFSELDALEQRGVPVAGRIVVSDRAHLVLPYHKLLDAASEKSQGIGTTGRGIGPAYEDKTGRRGIRAGDLCRLDDLEPMLASRVERANRLLELMGSSERASLPEHLALVERIAPRLKPLTADAGLVVHRAIQAKRRVLLEGAQGALLDLDHGTYPFVTSSNTTAGGAAVGAGIGPTAIDGVLGVVKAYTTRVGNGPLPTAAPDEMDQRLRELGGEFGAVTGRPRRCGWFDAMVVRYAVRVNGLTGLAVTKLDVLDTLSEIPVGIGYRLNGKPLDALPSEVALLERVEPVYETLPGWQCTTGEVRRLEDLPPAARAYLDRLQELAGAPIRYVSVGTRRDQIIQV